MNWPTGLRRWTPYYGRKADATESHGSNGTNGTAPAARAAADVQRPLAVATEHNTPDSGNGTAAPAAVATETPAPSAGTGHVVHDLLKGLEVSFDIEAAQLEREAAETARSWAEKGLPRHDLEVNGRLDVEDMLAHRTSHVFSD